MSATATGTYRCIVPNCGKPARGLQCDECRDGKRSPEQREQVPSVPARAIKAAPVPERPTTAKWTATEDAELRRLFATSTHRDIGVLLGKSEQAVRNRCWRLSLRKKSEGWSDDEIVTLRRWYEDRAGQPLEIESLCKILARRRPAVSAMARRLGLSCPNRPRSPEDRAGIARRSADAIRRNGHPRGMLGKSHSPETRAKISQHFLGRRLVLTEAQRQARSDRSVAMHANSPTANAYSRARRGRRDDLGDIFFRSAWEANYARFLNFLLRRGDISSWEYEPETFWFHEIQRGARTYLPDFKVVERSGHVYYVEVKGWMDAKSKTKLSRMAKYYPNVDLRLVDEGAYKEIARNLGGAIPGWERK